MKILIQKMIKILLSDVGKNNNINNNSINNNLNINKNNKRKSNFTNNNIIKY